MEDIDIRHRDELIRQMGSADNDTAVQAVDILSARGWLRDGSLEQANLRGANLSHANLLGAVMPGALLTNAELSGAQMSRVQLHNANLDNARLWSAMLSRADLHSSSLVRADLTDANLRSANLMYADLRRADLHGADLHGCYLNNADLRGAILVETHFNRSRLHQADFSGAVMRDTIFTAADLSDALGLDAIQHLGRSHLSSHMLSDQQLPVAFLRGVGITEPQLRTRQPRFHVAFLLSDPSDEAIAQRLQAVLQVRGVRAWHINMPIRRGSRAFDDVHLAIQEQDRVVILLSRNSLQSWWMESEVQRLLWQADESGDAAPRLIPVDLDGSLNNPDYDSPVKAALQSHPLLFNVHDPGNNSALATSITGLLAALRIST